MKAFQRRCGLFSMWLVSMVVSHWEMEDELRRPQCSVIKSQRTDRFLIKEVRTPLPSIHLIVTFLRPMKMSHEFEQWTAAKLTTTAVGNTRR